MNSSRFFSPYVKGFLVSESNVSVDVTAVYTAGDSTLVGSIDVEQIRERKIKGCDDDNDG